MKQKEQKILGIFAIIFGTLALLGSWIPIVNILSFFLAIASLILGVLGIAINLRNRKTLAIIGTTLGLISIVLVLITQVLSTNVFTDLARTFSHPYRNITFSTNAGEYDELPDSSTTEEDDEEDTEFFTWSQEQFDALVEGDTSDSGKGGSNYKDIIRKHGIPDSETDSVMGDYEIKRITYLSISSDPKTVVLTFVKQENGQFLLIRKFAVGLDRKEQSDSGVKV
ncbi:CD20-like domain-containing protein [Streptococcus sp. HMSC056C01]|uniref:CD20-like domain-containing protein n=1 Tax=Streptococcus TaxID=1301 RepID=UPI0008D20471|nr:CD20-like domain-containing protein [Streptococcus sp. HMSC056C01]OFK86084.1 hypothetical protein HMPREF2795_00290 [Streptococcus sp. HMSC056C01]